MRRQRDGHFAEVSSRETYSDEREFSTCTARTDSTFRIAVVNAFFLFFFSPRAETQHDSGNEIYRYRRSLALIALD